MSIGVRLLGGILIAVVLVLTIAPGSRPTAAAGTAVIDAPGYAVHTRYFDIRWLLHRDAITGAPQSTARTSGAVEEITSLYFHDGGTATTAETQRADEHGATCDDNDWEYSGNAWVLDWTVVGGNACKPPIGLTGDDLAGYWQNPRYAVPGALVGGATLPIAWSAIPSLDGDGVIVTVAAFTGATTTRTTYHVYDSIPWIRVARQFQTAPLELALSGTWVRPYIYRVDASAGWQATYLDLAGQLHSGASLNYNFGDYIGNWDRRWVDFSSPALSYGITLWQPSVRTGTGPVANAIWLDLDAASASVYASPLFDSGLFGDPLTGAQTRPTFTYDLCFHVGTDPARYCQVDQVLGDPVPGPVVTPTPLPIPTGPPPAPVPPLLSPCVLLERLAAAGSPIPGLEGMESKACLAEVKLRQGDAKTALMLYQALLEQARHDFGPIDPVTRAIDRRIGLLQLAMNTNGGGASVGGGVTHPGR